MGGALAILCHSLDNLALRMCKHFRLEKTKEVKIPCAVYSASLLKENRIFVCGGEDLKLYKYNYDTGEEIGKKSANYIYDPPRIGVTSQISILFGIGV